MKAIQCQNIATVVIEPLGEKKKETNVRSKKAAPQRYRSKDERVNEMKNQQ